MNSVFFTGEENGGEIRESRCILSENTASKKSWYPQSREKVLSGKCRMPQSRENVPSGKCRMPQSREKVPSGKCRQSIFLKICNRHSENGQCIVQFRCSLLLPRLSIADEWTHPQQKMDNAFSFTRLVKQWCIQFNFQKQVT